MHPPNSPWVRESSRPALIRVVGALTLFAVAATVASSLGIEAWLEQSMFELGSPGPEAVARGTDALAYQVGAVSGVYWLLALQILTKNTNK